MNKEPNIILDSWTAIVGGRETGLAGCSDAGACSRNCLRKDERLVVKDAFTQHPYYSVNECGYRVPLFAD